MKKGKGARGKKKPRHVRREQVLKLLDKDPSGTLLRRFLLKKGVGAPVENVGEKIEPLPLVHRISTE